MQTIKAYELMGALRALDHVYLVTHIGGPENVHTFEVTKKDVRRILGMMPRDSDINGYISQDGRDGYLFSR